MAPVLGDFEPCLDRDGDRSELLGYALADVEGQCWFPRPLCFRVQRGESRKSQWFALPPLHPVRDEGAWSSLGAPWRLVAQELPEGPEADEEDEADLLVSEALLGDILTGEEVGSSFSGAIRERSDLYQPETRLGLAMDNRSNTAQPGLLFSRPYRRFRGGISGTDREWRSAGFLAWYRVKDLAGHRLGEWDGTGFLGGDRRRARFWFEREDGKPLADLCDRVVAAAMGSAGFFLYLLTPGFAEEDGGPALEGIRPVATAVGRPLTVSGWDALSETPGPREIRTLYPAGSVFFYEWSAGLDDAARRAWIEKNWLEPLPGSWRTPGFGRALLGVWR